MLASNLMTHLVQCNGVEYAAEVCRRLLTERIPFMVEPKTDGARWFFYVERQRADTLKRIVDEVWPESYGREYPLDPTFSVDRS